MALTTAQLTTLKATAQADATAAAFMSAGNDTELNWWFNANASPDFTVWRNDVRAEETGNAWVGTDIDGMSALNMQRLQLLLASSPQGTFDMGRADRRAGFENPFGSNQNNASRVAMRAVWKRLANRAEKALATGAGTVNDPATLTFSGQLSLTDIAAIRTA
jgi:hypothetical protein